ncbi:hypothetical protein [Streptomyces sp. NBC_00358]|uniref:hypothetical protein n=1 Tax=Streptomyces sp. NBC_00358 TaxID=2975725 RepID=UPI002E269FF4
MAPLASPEAPAVQHTSPQAPAVQPASRHAHVAQPASPQAPAVQHTSPQVHAAQPVFTTAPQAAPRPKAVSPKSAAASEPSWGQSKRPPRAARGRSRDEVGWVKAHGGSGATSLVEAFGGVDVGARWPDPARGEPRRVVLVGRTNARGLRSVSQALGALNEGNAPQGLELLGVVLVADAPGRLPLGLLRRIRVLRSVARVHRLPWIPAWRAGGRPKSVPRQLATLARLVGGEPYGEGAAS